jgi:hypothetical protein
VILDREGTNAKGQRVKKMKFTWTRDNDLSVSDQMVAGARGSVAPEPSGEWQWILLNEETGDPLDPSGVEPTREKAQQEAEKALLALAREFGSVYCIAENTLTGERCAAQINYAEVEDSWILEPAGGYNGRQADVDRAGTFEEWKVVGIVTPLQDDRATQEILIEMLVEEGVMTTHVASAAIRACSDRVASGQIQPAIHPAIQLDQSGGSAESLGT